MPGVLRIARAKPLVLTSPVPYEDDLHQAVANALNTLLLPPAEWTTFPAGHVQLPGAAAAKLARLGLKRAWPDIFVLHGSLHGIELKRKGAKLSKTRQVRTRGGRLRTVEGQQEVFPRLIAAGMKIAVCDNVDDVLSQLAAWGVPLRRHSM
jgi:hypothetical protein